jgi:DNA-binding NarL/FixJ family response regulator
LRQGVRRLLEDEPDLEVVGEACTMPEVLQKVCAHHPDVVLIDAGMQAFSAVEAARLINQDYPDIRLIFLGTHPSNEEGGGAPLQTHDYLPKDTPARRLINLVRGEKNGVTPTTPPASDASRSTGDLTAREHEILRLIAEGNTARRVAELLGLSVKTVEAHKFNLMRKLDIHNRAQLVTYAIQHKVLSMPAN